MAGRLSTRRARTGWPVDLAGLALLAALAAWATLSAALAGGDASAMRDLLLALAAVLAAARLVSLLHPWAVPALLAGGAAAAAVANLDTLLARPLGNPLGYSNAVGALSVQAAAAALIVVARAPQRPLRVAAAVAAAGFLAIPWLNGTDTAAAFTPLLVLAPLAFRPSAARGVVLVAGVLTAAAVAVSTWLAFTYEPGAEPRAADRLVAATLSERRLDLWHDAATLMRAHPVTGVGVDRFAEHSPTARGDRDAAHAHHEPLEVGAEVGVAGFALVLALFAWGFVRLWSGPLDAGTAVAAVALAALGVHATVDFVLHFPLVGLAAAAVLGSAHVGEP